MKMLGISNSKPELTDNEKENISNTSKKVDLSEISENIEDCPF